MKLKKAGFFISTMSVVAVLRHVRRQTLAQAEHTKVLEREAGQARSWEAIACRERAKRQDYEAALGLSFWSEQRVAEELWERAGQGEPLAVEILKTQTRRVAEQTTRGS